MFLSITILQQGKIWHIKMFINGKNKNLPKGGLGLAAKLADDGGL